MRYLSLRFFLRFLIPFILSIIILSTQFMPMPSASLIKLIVNIGFLGIIITSLINLFIIKDISFFYRIIKIIVIASFAIFWFFETSHFPGVAYLFLISLGTGLFGLVLALRRFFLKVNDFKSFLFYDSWILLIVFVLLAILNASVRLQHEIIGLF